ncbi:response regulator [Leucothrix arctica]|uniref:Two-component system response regulator BaeR n=1 Tax=Leucothrix arctica TaxID=1481894 RepID=A0A317CM59_9GAMM|nr:response regulator [Leucothrix arctica]PWQ99618.1 two-component system response regulator BaeR [Leucothrix arctica]
MNVSLILIVEDEDKIAQILVDYLKNDGFETQVLNTGLDAVETVKTTEPDLVILDLMLPEKDGVSICREVRQFSNVPIMMLTAKVDEVDRLIGLELGADDYVCKPFLPREVVARVKTILRRVQSTQNTNDSIGQQLSYRSITLQCDRYVCLISNQRVELTPVEFRLLQTLMASPGRVFSRDVLIQFSYSDGRVVSDRTVDSHVKNLRKKVSAVTGSEELIHSIYGVGYKIE